MHRRRLMKQIDQRQVLEAIASAEQATSGEIRVSVSHFFWGSVRHAAERAFTRLNMTTTRERNGILFFIVPARRRFAVIGDTGIHEKVGQDFWDSLAEEMSAHFRDGDFSGGLAHAIAEAGKQLAVHFPYDRATDVNELPDEIDFGDQG
jgi:uncharacterized membrane protein